MVHMEAALIFFLINKFGGIVVDQAQAQSRCSELLLKYTTPPLDQIHARIERNAAKFRVIQSFLERSNQSTDAAAASEAWIKEVRVVAFKMEDIIDEYLYLVEEQRGRTWKDFLSRPSKLILCCNLAKAWHGIDSQIENMEKHLSELERMNNLYVLTINGNEDRMNSERDAHHYRVCDPMLIDEDDVVGVEENKSKLLSWLTNADTCRTTIAVWGMGGLGKTTLVSKVYHNNAVKSHFDCQVWVTVSQNYIVEELLRTVIQEIFKGKKEFAPNGITTMPRSQLLVSIKNSLQQKRYIVVLDDVWDEDLWKQMHHAFVDSNNGSRLVVTTRKHEVARIANEEHIIQLQKLNGKHAWSLLRKKAFRRENNINDCPRELKDYATKIWKKCQGSPLAITVIGSLLSTKEKSVSGWKEVYDCLHWEFEKNHSLDALKSILNLSFNDLPNYLKNCFIYCSIFPEDYLIKRKKLIRLWVAEGFVEEKNNNRVMEEEAEHYFAQLVDRSMLQVVERNEFGRLKAFRMHDVVREVTLEISKNMKFCMILEGSQSVLDDQTRRLSIQTNNESLDLDNRLSRLRSLVMFSTCNFSSGSLRAVLMSFKMLRVLELEGTRISNLPKEVSALFNLHYLGLKDSRVTQLPNNIQKLQSLQTLDLRDSTIVKLPCGVTKLKQLRHLFVPEIEVEFGGSSVVGCVPTLERAWQWKNLQTLKSVKANEKLVKRLGDMKELRSLEVVEVEQAHCPQLCASLTKMKNLRGLHLFATSEEQLDFETLNSSPPPLQKLTLLGRLIERKMPTFICSCAQLTHVALYKSHLVEDPLPSLGQLPKLVVLTLIGNTFDGHKLHFETGWFPTLKVLHLEELSNLRNIVIEEGAMLKLHELIMDELRELQTVPLGIEFLTNLKSLTLYGMPELVAKFREARGNEEYRRNIRHISKVIH